MALDFPNTPNEGDTHTEKGQTWAFINGAWVISGDGNGVDIVGADVSAGWQVWGDVLIQWGTAPGSALPGGRLILTYPQPFKDGTLPTITGTAASGSSSVTVTVNTGTTFDHLGCALDARFGNNNSLVSVDLRWIAIGEAPDALKKPKRVTASVGSGNILEFHDPTGVASWRIVGKTLECWGTISGGTQRTVTFPKSFARPPILTWGAESPTYTETATVSGVHLANTLTATEFEGFVRFTNPSNGGPAGGPDEASWHAIGEWDGNL